MHMLWHALEIIKQKGIIDTVEYFFFFFWMMPGLFLEWCMLQRVELHNIIVTGKTNQTTPSHQNSTMYVN